MNVRRFSAAIFFAFVLWALPVGAQAISTVVVSAPRVIMTAGETMQLRASARSNQGVRVPNTNWSWTSSNPAVISVNPFGVVTAVGLGVANIVARAPNNASSPALTLQALPQRIEIGPEIPELVVGRVARFQATAFDVNGQPIPNVTFAWSCTLANGNTNNAVGVIDNQGVFTPYGAAMFTIHAMVNYTGISAAHMIRFEGLTHVLVKTPVEYKLTRLLATDILNLPFALRAANGEFKVNDSGDIAFVGNFNGLSSALLLYQKGQLQVLAAAGVPGFQGASNVYRIESPPSINNSGQVAVRYCGAGPCGLLVASQLGVAFLPEGATPIFPGLNYFRAGRSSINDKGDVLFLGNYTVQNNQPQATGVFRLVNGFVTLLWSTTFPLPGFNPNYTLDNVEFGGDNAGNVYFTAQAGSARAVYKISADGGDPIKVIGTGSLTGPGTVRTILRISLSPNGSLAVTMLLDTGRSAIARIRLPDQRLETQPLLNVNTILGINDPGEVAYIGDPGSGPRYGLWRWAPPPNDTPSQVAPYGRLFNNAPFFGADSGGITSSGELFMNMTTTNNQRILIRPVTDTVLVNTGDRITDRLPLNFSGTIPGAVNGPVHVFGASEDLSGSILDVTSGQPAVIWAVGDQPLASRSIWLASKDPSGTLYVAFQDGMMRFQSSRFEKLFSFPSQFTADGTAVSINGAVCCVFYGQNSLAVNRNGTLVFRAFTDTFNRLVRYDRGTFTSLITEGGPAQTNSPAGGKFSGIANGLSHQNTVAIDDAGRVFVSGIVTGGPSGLFMYENGQWKTAALFGVTRVAGDLVTGVSAIHAADQNFYAMLNLTGGFRMIARYDGTQWIPLVRRPDVSSDGFQIGSMQSYFSANRRGDIAFIATGTRTRIVVRTADGKLHVVYSVLDATGSGDSLWAAFQSLELRDDGTLYFVDLNTEDKNTLYLAQPLF